MTRRGYSLKLKGTLYILRVSCLIYGSETWTMKMEHKVKLDRTFSSIWAWSDGCVGLPQMKGRKMQNRENCQDWNQSVWWLRKVDWDGLDTWNVRQIVTELNVQWWKWQEPNQGDMQGRHGGMVSGRIWKDLACSRKIHNLRKMEREN